MKIIKRSRGIRGIMTCANLNIKRDPEGQPLTPDESQKTAFHKEIK